MTWYNEESAYLEIKRCVLILVLPLTPLDILAIHLFPSTVYLLDACFSSSSSYYYFTAKTTNNICFTLFRGCHKDEVK